MHICDPTKCTACGACIQFCPKQCIEFTHDNTGRRFAKIQEYKCVDCGKCVQYCHVNNPPIFHFSLKCYAVRSKRYNIIAESSSGGLATEFGFKAIEKKGIYYGAKGFPVKIIACRSEAAVMETAGSKYTESSTGYSYKETLEALQKGVFVVYVGMPCQIAGLKVFLKKDFTNLVTVDLICHGMPPQTYLEEYFKWRKPTQHEQIDRIKFREAQDFILAAYAGNKMLYKREANLDIYATLFLKNMIFRDNCYLCPYAQEKRVADLTIGDFWGIDRSKCKENFTGNISCLLINTKRGLDFFLSQKENFIYEERPVQEAVAGNDNLRQPSVVNPERFTFIKNYKLRGFLYAIRRTSYAKEINWRLRNIKIKKLLKSILCFYNK